MSSPSSCGVDEIWPFRHHIPIAPSSSSDADSEEEHFEADDGDSVASFGQWIGTWDNRADLEALPCPWRHAGDLSGMFPFSPAGGEEEDYDGNDGDDDGGGGGGGGNNWHPGLYAGPEFDDQWSHEYDGGDQFELFVEHPGDDIGEDDWGLYHHHHHHHHYDVHYHYHYHGEGDDGTGTEHSAAAASTATTLPRTVESASLGTRSG